MSVAGSDAHQPAPQAPVLRPASTFNPCTTRPGSAVSGTTSHTVANPTRSSWLRRSGATFSAVKKLRRRNSRSSATSNECHPAAHDARKPDPHQPVWLITLCAAAIPARPDDGQSQSHPCGIGSASVHARRSAIHSQDEFCPRACKAAARHWGHIPDSVGNMNIHRQSERTKHIDQQGGSGRAVHIIITKHADGRAGLHRFGKPQARSISLNRDGSGNRSPFGSR